MKKWQIGLIIILLAVIAGMLIQHHGGNKKQSVSVTAKIAKKPAYWIDPMEPLIHYPGPGLSRMGMELVPVIRNETENNHGATIKISPVVVENLGIRTAPVEQGALARHISTVGYIQPNENRITHIHSYVEGWIKKLAVKVAGESVQKGQLLFQLYSPTLVDAEQEYLLALDSKNTDLVEASQKKLFALNISESQILQLKQTRKADQLVDIYAPQNGVITVLNVREGMRITPDLEIIELADLSTIWVIVEVFEAEANWVKVGQKAQATLVAYPGKRWQGEVEYVYPEVDATTRTLKARVHFTNTDMALKPGMYAMMMLWVEPKENILSIPKEALIRSGQNDRVVVALSDGRFETRSVTVGIESGGRAEILSGLSKGEQVVASGEFLIDSEASLSASTQRMETPAPAPANKPKKN